LSRTIATAGLAAVMGCRQAFRDDGTVNGDDLGILLAAWGSC
jgi:hypothetical protein